jgi:hypothetical protein
VLRSVALGRGNAAIESKRRVAAVSAASESPPDGQTDRTTVPSDSTLRALAANRLSSEGLRLCSALDLAGATSVRLLGAAASLSGTPPAAVAIGSSTPLTQFELSTSARTWTLGAETAEDAARWVDGTLCIPTGVRVD